MIFCGPLERMKPGSSQWPVWSDSRCVLPSGSLPGRRRPTAIVAFLEAILPPPEPSSSRRDVEKEAPPSVSLYGLSLTLVLEICLSVSFAPANLSPPFRSGHLCRYSTDGFRYFESVLLNKCRYTSENIPAMYLHATRILAHGSGQCRTTVFDKWLILMAKSYVSDESEHGQSPIYWPWSYK
jgi:hypothetical protein